MSKDRPRWSLRRAASESTTPEWLQAARRRIEEANRGEDATARAMRQGAAQRRAERELSAAQGHPAPIPAAPTVPPGLQIAGDYAWRIGVLILVGAGVFWGFSQVSTLVIPLMIAALLAGLLLPVKQLFRRGGLGNGLSVAATFIAFLVVIGGALALVVATMSTGLKGLWNQAVEGMNQVREWLSDGPLHVSNDQLNQWLDTGMKALSSNQSEIVKNAASGVSALTHIGAGLLLTLFSLIFFLLEGERIWRWVVRLFPRRARPAVNGAGRRGWGSLVSYVRVQLVVAFIDAVGIGAGAAILQVPLALQLGVLVFLGSFIPILGALITGAIAVLLALVAHGWLVALIMLGVVLLVQQVESHILQPLIMGRAVSLHPLAVVLAVAGGTMLFGVAGALFAVPVMAVVNTVVKYLATRAWEDDPVAPLADHPTASPLPDTEEAEPSGAPLTADPAVTARDSKE
jgi:putative heme transporter